MEQENNKSEVDNAPGDLATSQPSEKKNPNLLKAKSNIAKSMAKTFLKTRKATITSEGRSKEQKKKNKSVSKGSKATEDDAKKLNSNEENQQKDATTCTEHVDIAKSMAKNFLKTRKATGTSEGRNKRQKEKNKSVSEGRKAIEDDAKKLNSNEENQQKDATTSTKHVEENQQMQKNEESTFASDSQEKKGKSNDSPKKRSRGEEPGVSRRGKKRRKQNEPKEKHYNSEKNNKNKEKLDGNGKKQEKIDGLIFMCNAKTKPDCFRYHVMGVSAGKKDFVLGVRPGLKLFLYDYDLKLMYGIYKASSSGGMKLEPKAFGGAFPAQVRFRVHADCFPLSESIFKKAIKENYDAKNKFKTELTARQVRKLTELFRPVTVHSTALHVRSPLRAVARILEHPENREAHDRPREARPPSDNARSYLVLSHERDRQAAFGELPSTRREDIHRDLYLSEKQYRAYGLQGERRSSTLQHHISPRSGSYPVDYREQLLRQPDSVYRESVPTQRDIIRSDPLYLTGRAYDLGAAREMQSTVSAATANTSVAVASTLDSYAADPYYSRYYGASLVEPYLPHPIGEPHLIESDRLRRRESDQVDRVYSAYASDALAGYNQMHRHQDVKPEAASTSVSSRYSFAGPSFSYR
ncbi:hypothetical protein PTKIN_Ptkin01aG0372500 [Pterospermum kingtungense]